MSGRIVFACIVAAAALSAGAAGAGPATDAFSKCLTDSSTGKDRVVFVRWVFSAIAAHPDVRSYASLTDEQRATFSREAAEIMNRLILRECRREVVAAIKADGDSAIESGFGVFGEVAMGQLLSDKTVNAAMGQMASFTNEKGFAELKDEAKAK